MLNTEINPAEGDLDTVQGTREHYTHVQLSWTNVTWESGLNQPDIWPPAH